MRAKLRLEHLQKKVDHFKEAEHFKVPPIGWIRSMRTAFGLSMKQLARKMRIQVNDVSNIEEWEAKGEVRIKDLKRAGAAMDMKFVYGFVPKDGSIDELIERKAKRLATEMVLSTYERIPLSDIDNYREIIRKEIEQKTKEIILELPNILWE